MDYITVRTTFDYCNGNLYWKTRPANCIHIGDKAGGFMADGYGQIQYSGEHYLIHRLIWLWHHGYFPENQIDHIDRNRKNNRIENLREVTCQCNSRNCGNPKDNTSGVKGISWNVRKKKWKAKILDNYLGYYINFNDAVLARLKAEQQLSWKNCDNSSPAYCYAIEHGLITKKEEGQYGRIKNSIS